MWINAQGGFYTGDMVPGDRAATAPELAVIALGRAKQQKAGDISKALEQEIAWGLAWQGEIYQIDQTSQDRIGNRAQVARDCIAALHVWSPLYSGWIAADNSRPEFTAEDFMAFAYAAHDLFTAIMLNARTLKDALAAANTLAAVAAIDPQSGWPVQE